MPVHIPPESEAHETIPDTPVAMVDKFEVEEGNPKGFPTRPKHPKPDKEGGGKGGEKQGIP